MGIPHRPYRWRLMAMAVLLTVTVTPAPGIGQGDSCLHGPGESAYHRARREAAIGFIQGVNQAERLLRLKEGRFAHLTELVLIDRSPVGFVPTLTVDRWNYALLVKDALDACGFILVSDQEAVIYEGRPVAPSARTSVTSPDAAGE